jgi:hypothetical protein
MAKLRFILAKIHARKMCASSSVPKTYFSFPTINVVFSIPLLAVIFHISLTNGAPVSFPNLQNAAAGDRINDSVSGKRDNFLGSSVDDFTQGW